MTLTVHPGFQGMEFTQEKIALLKQTVCKGASDAELELFKHICQRTGLDPFAKQIYAIKRNEKQKDGSWREAMTIQTSIDGYRLIAERTRGYAPGREPAYSYTEAGHLISATAYIRKQTDDGTWHEVAATAFYSEYVQTDKEGKPVKFWQKMPHTMLAKCAESLALRKAFPADFSGIYTKEEMGQASLDEIAEPTDYDAYIQSWGEQKEMFLKFKEHVMASCKWTEEKTLGEFVKHADYTKSSFEKWIANQVTKVA